MAIYTQSQFDNMFANASPGYAPPRRTTIGGKNYLTEKGTVYLLEGNNRIPITDEQELIKLEIQGKREGVMVNTPYQSPESLPKANDNSGLIMLGIGGLILAFLLKK